MASELGTLTTPDLLDFFQSAPDITPREQALVDRLASALDEIDMLVDELALMSTAETERDA